uniref:Radical SAM domain-containing protein n=4 Tax=environmental samples TaxID=651140 RepID=A0A075H3X2_9ARCH|nr:radical SAM domain-containing protein [uncultured marine thaumarchaeote KM3_157_H08]AIF10741.1 radical SAM domain-containing protein [uncultured marine thaumarchaeote KM3_47_A03]AIF10789.1 radical SAM domain-containing protein [uncultured marine thaumarchaeote KM3_47_A04]
MMLNYAEPVYRPPSEAKSLIFQVTLGCSFNQCSFCDMYRNKKYSEKTWDEVKAEIDLMAKQLPDTTRIFLADGDALNISTEYMVQIVEYLYNSFPKLERVSCYAMPMNLLKKTPEELKKMHEAGLKMLYLGIESGSDIILKKITKGATAETIIRACRKAIETGFTLSCIIILGLGGKTYSKEHIKETARVVNASSPDYLGTLTLILETGVKQEFLTKFGEEFHPINDEEALIELHDLVEQIDVKEKMLFRANHGSNAYNIAGTFPDEKNAMLEKISWLKEHPENVRPEGFRAF